MGDTRLPSLLGSFGAADPQEHRPGARGAAGLNPASRNKFQFLKEKLMSYEHLVDHSLVAEAQAKLDAANASNDAAMKKLTAAREKLAAAEAVSASAIARGGDGIVEEEAIAAARVRVSAAEKVYSAEFVGTHNLEAAVKQAKSLSQRGIFWDGLRKRIAACAAHEKAKADVAAAEVAYAESEHQIKAALAAGYPAPFASGLVEHSRNEVLDTQQLIKMWANNGYDADAQTFRGSSL